MAADTEFVCWLVESGFSPRRARAFEQWLADERPVGISPELLVKHVKRRADWKLQSAMAEQRDDVPGQQKLFVDTPLWPG